MGYSRDVSWFPFFLLHRLAPQGAPVALRLVIALKVYVARERTPGDGGEPGHVFLAIAVR